MNRRWFYVHQGQQQGPVSAQELINLHVEGTLPEDAAVWAEGMEGWAAFGSTELLDAARKVEGLAPAGKRQRRMETRPAPTHALPPDFASWLPELESDEEALARLFSDALLYFRPHVVTGLPRELRDALLSAYVRRHPDSDERDPGACAFTDAFLLDCVDDFDSPRQARAREMWEVMGAGNLPAVRALVTRAAQLDNHYLGQVYALYILSRAQRAIDAGDAGALLALLKEDRGLAGARDLRGRSVWHRLALASAAGEDEGGGGGGAAAVEGARGGERLLAALLAVVEGPAAYLDLPDREGNTPLHLAIEGGRLGAARRLLEAGADANARNRDASKYAGGEWSVRLRGLDFAIPVPVDHQDAEAVRLLLDVGASPSVPMGDIGAPLHCCCAAGAADLVSLLLAAGAADVDAPGKDGWRPLALAARRGTAACVAALLAAGADAAALSQGKTALQVAELNKRAACVEALRAAAAAAARRRSCRPPARMAKARVTEGEALRLAAQHFGFVAASAERLPGYDDVNMLLTRDDGTAAAASGGPGPTARQGHRGLPAAAVLKVVNAAYSAAPGFCEAQAELLLFLADWGVPVPRPLPARAGAAGAPRPEGGRRGRQEGEDRRPGGEDEGGGDGGFSGAGGSGAYTAYVDIAGACHALRLLTFLPGTLLRDAEQTLELYREVGAFMGRVDALLAGFDHLALHRTHPWVLDALPAAYAAARPALAGGVLPPADLALLDDVVAHFGAATAALSPAVRRQIIHSDANEANVLVGSPCCAGAADLGRGDGCRCGLAPATAITGLLDFGDSCHQLLANEPAAAAAYAALEHLRLGGAAPLAAAGALLRGYSAALPLAPEEVGLLRTLMAGRLAQSLALGAKAATEQPGNAEYVLRTQAHGWALLRMLWAMGEAKFRAAVGM
eukprot:scaffold9.g3100.t1